MRIKYDYDKQKRNQTKVLPSIMYCLINNRLEQRDGFEMFILIFV